MKKILATLLVATMLLSCLTFVGFASEVTITTEATYPYSSLLETVTADFPPSTQYVDPGFLKLTTYSDSDLIAYMQANNYQIDGYTLTKGSYVVVPFIVNGLVTMTVDVTWNKDVLTYVDCAGAYNPGSKGATDGYVCFNGFNSAATDVTGKFGAVILKVKDDAVGDKDGNLTTDITFAMQYDNGENLCVSSVATGRVAATVINDTMSVSLTGLTPGAEEDKEDTVIAQEDVNAMTAAATERVTIAENSNLEDILGDKVQSLNGNTDISKATAYKAVFATINLTDKITENVEFGFVLRDKNGVGADRFFEATAQFGGKYGVAFFGTPEVLGWYEAIPAVKVNGQLLLNTSEKEAL